jgi:hypothetical protein
MKSNISAHAVIAHAAIFLLWYANIAVGDPTFQYKFKERVPSKSTNSITALNSEERTVFLVTDPSGIGSATINLVSGCWPKKIALRLRYEKGRGFHRLEGFTITTAHLQARGGMQDSGKMGFYFLDAGGKHESDDAQAGEMNIVVEERNHAMEVTLPPNLLVGSKHVKIEWIDAYR